MGKLGKTVEKMKNSQLLILSLATNLLLVIILITISDKNILFSDKNILFSDKYFFQ